jgi:hypothetical protein
MRSRIVDLFDLFGDVVRSLRRRWQGWMRRPAVLRETFFD